MTRYAPNAAGIDYAENLIDAHQYVLETSWQEEAPGADEENADLERHDRDQHGSWHLAVDRDASEDTKDRYGFPYGDFRWVHRSVLVAAKARAAQNDHDEIAAAASRLLEHLDAVAADR